MRRKNNGFCEYQSFPFMAYPIACGRIVLSFSGRCRAVSVQSSPTLFPKVKPRERVPRSVYLKNSKPPVVPSDQ